MPNSKITVTRSLALNRESTGAIIGIKGYLLGKIIRIRPDQRVLLGRDASQCDILLMGDMVSRVHCSICFDGKKGKYIVNDLSTNGILVDQKYMLKKRQNIELQPGSQLFIGSEDNVICLG